MSINWEEQFRALYKAAADCEAPVGTQLDDVLARFQPMWDRKPNLTWKIVGDLDGDTHIECPNCGGIGTIVEVDQAVRFNELLVNEADDPKFPAARLGESGDWDHDHWFCTSCMTDALDAPDGFEIKDWI